MQHGCANFLEIICRKFLCLSFYLIYCLIKDHVERKVYDLFTKETTQTSKEVLQEKQDLNVTSYRGLPETSSSSRVI